MKQKMNKEKYKTEKKDPKNLPSWKKLKVDLVLSYLTGL